MTPKQARFVAEYLIDLNATQAAIRAGYSPQSADKNASRLMGNEGIRTAIEAGKGRQLEAAELTAVRVLEEYRRLAFSDLRGFFDAAGNLKPIHELTPEQGATLAGLEVIKKNAVAGDGQVDVIHKFKVWDKTRALEGLAKHFGLLTERLEHTGAITIRHELPE